ncbi:MAG TPA: sigma-70 family RNA polymerase sigma factor [Terracidiphilus sp.]|jgi:RNA polymerase sigma-70 factor (ECF subfamily)|nr:sigma-70 family RNA polymerase sigma factor [Terracidiphilus sp.]
MLKAVSTAAPEPDELLLSEKLETQSATSPLSSLSTDQLPGSLQNDLYQRADAGTCGLTTDEFARALSFVGLKHNFGLPAGLTASPHQIEAFFTGLHLPELALAQACALGCEAAWEIFLRKYRGFLTQTAIAITGSSGLGQELADSLYAELYGLRAREGERRSPFASYSGRGSLQGWLRTTLVQRFHDHHRRTHRESRLDELEFPAPESVQPAAAPDNSLLALAVSDTLRALPAESRFLLAAYFLDQQTLLQIARALQVHEATVSRRLTRLVADVRKHLLADLHHRGLSKRSAQEALGTDPRDVEINLRASLQATQVQPFSEQEASTKASKSL